MSNDFLEIISVINTNHHRVEDKLDVILEKVNDLDKRLSVVESKPPETPSEMNAIIKFAAENPKVFLIIIAILVSGYPVADIIEKLLP